MPEKPNQPSDELANPSRGVQVSAEQEMLSETDQADLETTLHGMNIPVEDENEEDSKKDSALGSRD